MANAKRYELYLMRGSVCDDQETFEGTVKAATARAKRMLAESKNAELVDVCLRDDIGMAGLDPVETVTRDWIRADD